MPTANRAYAAVDKSGRFELISYETRDPRDDEILVKVKYCGICHSDIHTARSEWANTEYPIVTGHEFIGEVVKVGKMTEGKDASRYPVWKEGDIVGVGCLVDSCHDCKQCNDDWEQHCRGRVLTYDAKDSTGESTKGGYGKYVILNRRFAVRIPQGVDYKDAAPLLCAGITTYSPIKQYHMDRGNLKIGVLGLGGLGHMAVQYASKMNPTNEVYALSRSEKKKELAMKLGAKGLIAVGDAHFDESKGEMVGVSDELKSHFNTFDYLIDTVCGGSKPMEVYAALVAPRGTWVTVGLPPLANKLTLPAFALITKNMSIAGSCIGGLKETQEMIDFSFKHNCLPMVEHITADKINEAMERVIKGDIMFRFVIDVEQSYHD